MHGDRFPTGLAGLEATLYDLITAPEGVAMRLGELGRTPEDLESVVKSSPTMSSVERLDVYANMYFYRILDVLRDEYSRVLAALGDATFHNLITAYLVACRPAHPSLREAGARLPGFVAKHGLAEGRPWVGELAWLERVHLELFDGPDAEVLTIEGLRARAPESLPSLLVRAIPCHAVLRNRFAIAGAWRALGARESVDRVPEVAETLLVWRQGIEVFHRVVDADEEPLLPMIRDGVPFDAVCERLLEQVSDERVAIRAFEILGGWVRDGMIEADPRGDAENKGRRS
jgi:hypothetical protein